MNRKELVSCSSKEIQIFSFGLNLFEEGKKTLPIKELIEEMEMHLITSILLVKRLFGNKKQE